MIKSVRRVFGSLARDKRAAASIEYALIAVLIAIGIIAALQAVSDSLLDLWGYVDSNVTGVMP